MKNFKRYALILFLALLSLIFSLLPKHSAFDGKLTIVSIDVGQGDSTLITTPEKYTILIDAGKPSESEKVISTLHEHSVKKIDALIATHPDTDHIGSIPDVISNFKIVELYLPDVQGDNQSFEDMIKLAKEKNIPLKRAMNEVSLPIKDEVKAGFISPYDHDYSNTNQYSAVLYLKYGNNKFLFMGDAENRNEEEILSYYPNLKCDFLKVGHHGSKTSSSDRFIGVVKPEIALISCGYKNSFHHPSKRVMKLLKDNNIKVFRTDEQHNIIFTSDGNTIYSDKESGSYKYGK